MSSYFTASLPAYNAQIALLPTTLDPGLLPCAYDYTRIQIDDFLTQAAAAPQDYGGNVADATVLTALKDRIMQLSIGGVEYIDTAGTKGPPQSIRRNLNAAWAPIFPNSSKFAANPYIDYNHPIWAGSDLLGLFLSSFGPAPAGATYSNFYVPLLCVFGRWCQVLSQDAPTPPSVQIPYMYQITWLSPTANNPFPPLGDVFFLGASLGGYDLGDPAQVMETGAWLDELRATRYNLVPGDRILAAGFVPNNIDSFPGTPVGNRFGNCAEVYPMLTILGNRFDATLYEANGAAMGRRVFENATTQYHTPNWVPQLDREAYKNVVKPCQTCDVILRQFKVTAADVSDRFCKRLVTNIGF